MIMAEASRHLQLLAAELRLQDLLRGLLDPRGGVRIGDSQKDVLGEQVASLPASIAHWWQSSLTCRRLGQRVEWEVAWLQDCSCERILSRGVSGGR